jgi:hypothetical protein
MGGNYRCEIDGKKVSGRSLKVSRPSARSGFTQDVKMMLSGLNDMFTAENGVPLWPDLEGNINDLLIFGGSTEHVFDPNISEEEFNKYKDSFSDIDIYIPQAGSRGFLLMNMIDKNAGRIIGNSKFKIVCTKIQNEDNANTRGTNSLFQYLDGKGEPLVQFDFMPQPIPVGDEDEKVSSSLKRWVKMSHSSNWRDVQSRVKGVFHKYLLQSLVSVSSRLPGVIATPKSPVYPPEKVKPAKRYEPDLHMRSFSVEKALGTARLTRQKYVDPASGQEVEAEYQGQPLYKLTDPKEKKYTTDVEEIFKSAFGFEPEGDDLEKMRSFIGLLEIMREKLLPTPEGRKICESVIRLFIFKLFGDAGQEISTYSRANDQKPKDAAINAIRASGFDELLNQAMPDLDSLIEKYYERFAKKMEARGSLVKDDEEELAPIELEESVRRFVRFVVNA